ncbi:MAG: hypothetical protein A4S09_02865 [Proteobacteria bacterium SG_bin7]|nr:MAG: hypothetical protein A4S09_02865 [Proteobacteria bacterium SG_bin7]
MEIKALPEDVINKIAAGEVVEKPAHMVKELLENSLDASADKIRIEVEDGGRNVRITDNGVGISSQELSMALERHTTSKIRAFDDLASLNSFGFRGEALATIGSVSRLEITSRPEKQKEGFGLKSEFGKKSSPVPSPVNPGTTVAVQELFANVPARLKFLKSATSEVAQIRNVVQAVALSHPEIEFTFQVNRQLDKFYAKTTSNLERAKQVLEIECLFANRAELGSFCCEALFASPDLVKGNSKGIWIFVQNRFVQDRGLQAAVLDAYRSLLMHGEYPVVVVHLKCEPSEVDVNVHPTKSQVRFRDNRQAFQVVHRALRLGLEAAPWNQSREPRPFRPALEKGVAIPLSFSAEEFDTITVKQKVSSVTKSYETSAANEAVIENSGKNWGSYHLVGQVNSTYLVAQTDTALVLIDQHAAHERIYFERLMRSFKSGAVDIQNYLLPLTLSVPAHQVENLLNLRSDFLKLGIDIDQGGVDSVVVRAAPAWISESALEKTILKTAEDLSEKGGSFALEKSLAAVCASLACHSAIRAGQTLSADEMQSLTSQMEEFAFSNYCPHGRPVSVEIPWAKLERDFGRIV